MTDLFLSLLYPDEEARRAHAEGSVRPDISARTCEELGLSALLPLKNSSLCPTILPVTAG